MRKKPKVVCQICWKTNCPLFIRMAYLRFTDEERVQYIKAYHRDVCSKRRYIRCSCHWQRPVRKTPGRNRVLPLFWINHQLGIRHADATTIPTESSTADCRADEPALLLGL